MAYLTPTFPVFTWSGVLFSASIFDRRWSLCVWIGCSLFLCLFYSCPSPVGPKELFFGCSYIYFQNLCFHSFTQLVGLELRPMIIGAPSPLPLLQFFQQCILQFFCSIAACIGDTRGFPEHSPHRDKVGHSGMGVGIKSIFCIVRLVSSQNSSDPHCSLISQRDDNCFWEVTLLEL